MKAQREVWGSTLVELARHDDRIVVLDGDLATSTRADLFAAAHPSRFYEIGIAEQNIVGIGFGMATLGFRPWLSSFGVFFTHRAADQIRMLVAQTGVPVKIAAAYAGILTGSAGKTHHDVQDLAIMRAMPGMAVIAPADAVEAAAAIRWAADYDGPVYLRLARDAVADVFDESYEFTLGAVHVLREGDDATLVSTGVQTSRVMEAAALLNDQGVRVRVVHVGSIKPLDEAALLASLRGVGPIITVEDHSVFGGLGGLVAEVVAGAGLAAQVVRVGLADCWSESAPNEYLLDKYGLSPFRVAERVRLALSSGA